MIQKELNILYIITKLELGGAQKVCLTLFKGLANSGNNSILMSGDEGVLVNEVKNSQNLILLKNLKREVSFLNIFYEVKNFFSLIKEIKKIKKKYPDLIVHTHSTKAGIIGRWAAFFANVKNRIHTIHGYAFHDHQNKILWFFIYFAELITSLITTHFICVSSKDIQIGKKLFPGFSRKHSLIRAAVEWDKFYSGEKDVKPARPEPVEGFERFIFGTVSCFKKQKNLIDLFKAFKEVQKKFPNSILEVIGDGILRSELEQWIKENNLEKNIILHGWQQNVAEIMLNWNVFVLTSLWEGLPCAIVEARLSKLPVIAYDTGGISDVILHGKNGFLIKQKDWLSMANVMLKIINDTSLYNNLKNYPQDLNEFKNSSMVEKHINLYQNF